MEKLFLYGVPGKIGGAATKIRDLLRMLRHDYDITVVLGHVSFLKEKEITGFMDQIGVKYCLRKDVPQKVDGVALGICEIDFFTSRTAEQIKKKGLKLVWANCMMWEFKGEAEAVRKRLIDRVLFNSEIQQSVFSDLYRGLTQILIRNYVTPDDFPYVERRNSMFTIGRLSRPDPVKYPVDFPVFYEELGLDDVKYRVQAWSDELKRIYRWHRFGPEWELLPEKKIPAAKFLGSLDLFVYPLGHRFIESWGRSTVEAMLTGSVPLVPTGHQFHNVMVHGESGFICKNFAEFKYWIQQLFRNHSLRQKISHQAASYVRNIICDFEKHRCQWIEALTFC